MTVTTRHACAVLCGLALCLAYGLGRPDPALAHSVYMFAWVDGNRVCSESYFAKNSKVRQGRASARAVDGRMLAEGLTDEQGLWCFAAPEPQELMLTVNAGQGHQANFALPAKAFSGSGSAVSQTTTPDDAPGQTTTRSGAFGSASGDVSGDASDQTALSGLIKEAVRAELQSQLAPVRQALAERDADHGPTLRDIFGGLGWIIGLAGLAAWYTNRRKR